MQGNDIGQSRIHRKPDRKRRKDDRHVYRIPCKRWRLGYLLEPDDRGGFGVFGPPAFFGFNGLDLLAIEQHQRKRDDCGDDRRRTTTATKKTSTEKEPATATELA